MRKRKKGRNAVRKPVRASRCRWYSYENGQPKCLRKISANGSSVDAVPPYPDESCDMTKWCGYEEDVPENSAVKRLSLKIMSKSAAKMKRRPPFGRKNEKGDA